MVFLYEILILIKNIYDFQIVYKLNKPCPRELSSVDMNNAQYMQGPGFKPRPSQKNSINHVYLFQ